MIRTDIEVVCCGHAAYDLNFFMDEYPVEDRKYKIDKLVETGGGPAANATSLLAKWGVPAAYAGLLGDDIYGGLIKQELETWGVDTSLVQIGAGKRTPLSAVIVNRVNGSRTLLNRRDAADQPEVSSEALNRLNRIDPAVLHFDGHALNLSLEMMSRFPKAAVVIDAGSYREATDKLCAKADYAICSRRYAEECTGLDDIASPEGMRRCMKLLKARYGGRVVVTLGGEGLFYDSAENRVTAGSSPHDDGCRVEYMPAFKVEAVDSTGAGDIFHGAFSYGIIRNFGFKDSLRIAAAAAAISVTRPGAKPSIPTLRESLSLADVSTG